MKNGGGPAGEIYKTHILSHAESPGLLALGSDARTRTNNGGLDWFTELDSTGNWEVHTCTYIARGSRKKGRVAYETK